MKQSAEMPTQTDIIIATVAFKVQTKYTRPAKKRKRANINCTGR
jgi:hypothetical protein